MWKMVVRPKNKDGLGIERLKEKNKALLLNGYGGSPLSRTQFGLRLSKASSGSIQTGGMQVL